MSRASANPTLRDVARRAGVAPITASRILNGSSSAAPVAADTRTRVERAAAALGYRLDGVARAMRQRRSGQIGAVVANDPSRPLVNLAAYEYILGINAGLAARGFVLSLVRITDLEGGGERMRELDERLLDGLVVMGNMPAAVLARIRALAVPTVWLDTDVDEPLGCVRRDEVAAGRDAAGLLLARGRRRLLWLERPAPVSRNHYSRADREAGARAACAAAGAEFVIHPIGSGFEVPDPAGLRRLLADPATGLLLADPVMTTRALALLVGFGLVPGRDLGVASCDADSNNACLWPELSRVEVHRHAIGEQAARLLADGLGEERLPASVLVRSPVVAGATA